MTRKILTPGATESPPTADTADDTGSGQAGRPQTIEELQALLAQRDSEISSLRATKAKPPTGIYEPLTPKGKAALEASGFSHLTTAQLIAKIDAGEVKEPLISVLCADGYYCSRRVRQDG